MRDTFRKFMAMLDRSEKRRFWLLCAFLVIGGFANMAGVALILPFLTIVGRPELIQSDPRLSFVYEGLGFSGQTPFLIFLAVCVTVFFLVTVAIKAATSYAIAHFGSMRSYSITSRILKGFLAQPYAWFLNRHSADLSRTLLGEVNQVVNGSIMPLLVLLSNLAVSLFIIGLLLLVDPVATLMMAAILGASYALMFFIVRKRLQEAGRRRKNAARGRFRTAQEALSGIKEIKVFNLEDSALNRYRKPGLEFAEAMAASTVLSEVPQKIQEGVAFTVMILVLMTLLLTHQGDIASLLPIAGVYAVAGIRLTPAMQSVFKSIARIRFNRATLNSVYRDFQASRAVEVDGVAVASIPLTERIELRDVVYAYKATPAPALNGLSLEIRACTTVGIVGGTGAGKTTLVDIVLGLLTPQQGALVVDGREIVDGAARRGWQRSLGYVPQQIFLTDDSVAANIAFGLDPEEIDMEAVERAARLAQIHDFVTTQMPEGYLSKVGDRGVRLSGGQRQRIGIARALYRDPDVLVFDEATSALDNLTEQALMEAVAGLSGVKTVIMVAHRLTTVRNCDEIFFLENGRVSARGSYDTLIEASPSFRKLALGAA